MLQQQQQHNNRGYTESNTTIRIIKPRIANAGGRTQYKQPDGRRHPAEAGDLPTSKLQKIPRQPE